MLKGNTVNPAELLQAGNAHDWKSIGYIMYTPWCHGLASAVGVERRMVAVSFDELLLLLLIDRFINEKRRINEQIMPLPMSHYVIDLIYWIRDSDVTNLACVNGKLVSIVVTLSEEMQFHHVVLGDE